MCTVTNRNTILKFGSSQLMLLPMVTPNRILSHMEKIAVYLCKGSTQQYFRPSLSYQLSLRPLFYLFLSGPFYTGFTVHFISLVRLQGSVASSESLLVINKYICTV